MALSNNEPALEQTDAPEQADFFLLPEYLDGLLDNVGVDGMRHFLATLPFFGGYADRHIFYSNHDNNTPFDLPSIFFQVSINRFKRDPGAFAIPYPAQWMRDITPDFNFARLRYLTSFSGNIASAPVRGELVLAAQQEQRLSVFVDPTAGFHCHIKSPHEQQHRRKRYLTTLADSLTVLCPRGEGTNSIRFFETLAAGRIPILVSDCCLLPYEDQIEYSSCCLKIAEPDIAAAGRILADWIVVTGQDRLFAMCRQARAIWEQHFSEQAVTRHTIACLQQLRDHHRKQTSAPHQAAHAADHHTELDQAIALHEQGDCVTAARIYERLLQQHPNDPQLYYLRGTAALQLGQYPEAIAWLERAVSSSPDKAEYATHLAIAHQKNGDHQQAEQLLRHVLTNDPTNSIAWLNLGITLHSQHQLEEALACFRRAEALAPADPRPPQNAATVCQALGRLDEAERLFVRALVLKPDYGTARWNLALLRLLRGDYQRGFTDFDARFCKTDPIPRRHTNLPAWNGVTDNCRLLIWAEQGLGDTLQFVRYIPLLAARGISVILEVQDHTLLELCRTLSGVQQVIVRGTQLPAADFQAALLDLPRLFGTTLQTIPDHIPYLLTSNEKYRTWRERLPSDKPLVGLVWRGNPGHINDANRSCSLELLLQLTTKLPNIRFLNLQWQPTQAETSLLQQHGIFDPTADLQQLDDTAALLAHLDLLITVDTAVAHLAGALGRPVWMLLPFAPDWRWGVKESSSPWYPSIRLFRQEAPRDWQGLIANVARQLEAVTAPGAPTAFCLTPVDATTDRQPVITMSSLGQYGLGNQLFQYAFLKLYATLHQIQTEIPVWLGTFLFGHTDSPITHHFPQICIDANTHNKADTPRLDTTLHNIDLQGFFQYHTSFYAPYKSYFRSLFRPVPPIAERLSAAVTRLRSLGKTAVGIHIRRGDYAYVNHRFLFMAPTAWYRAWLQELWGTLDNPVLFIASDEPENVFPDFSDFNPVSYLDLDPTLTPDVFCASYYIDFYLLSICDMVAISNSTFSFTACMLNETGATFMRPHLPTQRLIPFDPWDSEVLLRDEP